MTPQEMVQSLWSAFDRFEFDAVAELLHDDFICDWPQSRERIRGRDNFIAINTHYPGQWRIEVTRLVAAGDEVVTEIVARHQDQANPAVSFFHFRDGKIISIREYWPEPYEAQPWRKQWVESMPHEQEV